MANSAQVFYDENQTCFMSYYPFIDMEGEDESVTEVKVIEDGDKPILYFKFRGKTLVSNYTIARPTQNLISRIMLFTKHLDSESGIEKIFLLANHPSCDKMIKILSIDLINDLTNDEVKIEQWDFFETDNFLHFIIPDVPECILSVGLEEGKEGCEYVFINKDMDISCPNKKYVPNKIHLENITDPDDIRKINEFEFSHSVEKYRIDKKIQFEDICNISQIPEHAVMRFISNCCYYLSKFHSNRQTDLLVMYENIGDIFDRESYMAKARLHMKQSSIS